jgi:2',3'-cyclic-nucleotide 2'-phosphodiesterase
MRLLFIGDIVGTPGIQMVKRGVPFLRERERIDCVVANAENASAGTGLYPNNYKQIRSAGIDALTMGDHIYKRIEIVSLIQRGEPICKPANFPPDAPGKDYLVVELKSGTKVGVISLMGRTFMRPVDCPFLAADRILASMPADVKCILVDVHAEATADKYLLAHHLKGRVSAVLGTHTHVPTADEQILGGATAFVCDVGMTGPYGGILGRRVDRVLPSTISFVPTPFDVCDEDPRLGGAIVDIDEATGKATAIRRVMLTKAELEGSGAVGTDDAEEELK